jgi:hypothetical protein
MSKQIQQGETRRSGLLGTTWKTSYFIYTGLRRSIGDIAVRFSGEMPTTFILMRWPMGGAASVRSHRSLVKSASSQIPELSKNIYMSSKRNSLALRFHWEVCWHPTSGMVMGVY